jgi:capsular polysaccharide biosynthesis protein
MKPLAQSESAVTTLCPETTSRRKLPLNLKPDDLSLFSGELERVIPPTRLLNLQNVSVSPEGILFQNGRMLPESFAFPHTRASWKRRSVVKFFVNNYALRRHRQFEKECVLAIDDWSFGYFHWLADVLPRLFTIRERLKDLVLLLPHKYKDVDFVQASLVPFNLGGVEYIDPNEVLVCKDLLVPTQTAPSGHYNEELIRGVGDLLAEFYASDVRKKPQARVFISRREAPKRRILNEEEVTELLREFDFRIVRTEQLSFAEQVKLTASARYLVSNHGAGLTNMLFMKAGSTVLELRHFSDCINNCYFTLAAALKLNYFYQSCEPAKLDEDPHTADLRVDIDALKTNLELMLET